MKAIVLHHRGAAGVSLCDMPRPECPPGWARVRMIAASVNRVDLYMRDTGAGISHQLPLIMGVDGVGEVIEAPDRPDLAPGDRVILYPYEFCGRCRPCLAGDQPLCHSARILGEHRHGTFAEEVALPSGALVKLAPGARLDQAAVLGVAYLTAWRMVFGKAPAGPGAVVLIPPGIRQRITNTGEADLIFLAVCTPRFTRTVYQDLESEGGPERGHDAQL